MSGMHNRNAACALPGYQVAHGLAALAAVLIVALVALVNADIVARIAFDRPLRGVSEIISVCLPVTVFLVVAWSSISGGLIRAGLLSRWFRHDSSLLLRVLDVVFDTLALAVALAIAAASWPWLIRAWRDSEFLGVAGEFTVPMWPATAAVFSGATLLAVYTGMALFGSARRLWRQASWCALLPFAALTLLPLAYMTSDTRASIGGVSIALMFVLLYGGLPVAYALFVAAALGIAFIKHDPGIAIDALGMSANGAVSSYVFGAVPFFVLLGLVMGRADIGRDALQAAHWFLRHLTGALGVATVAANAIFAAITGISIASAAIFSKIAVPPLIEQGFTTRFAVGLVAGSSILGMLIPPSLLLIIYGIVAEVSINALFVAAIVPGLVLTAAFSAVVVIATALEWPFAVSGQRIAALPTGGTWHAWRRLIPVAILIATVLGGIYAGLFTPTEAGAVGSLVAVVIALAMRRLRLTELGSLLFECAETSAAILFLLVAASAFGVMLTLSGIPAVVGGLVAQAGLGLSGYVVIYLGCLIVLGMVLDSTSIMLIMVPIALPTVKALGGDPIWFGIVTVIGVEIGLLTPPLGLSVFAIKSSLDDPRITLNDIFTGALPFAAIMLAVALALVALPGAARLLN